MWRKVLLPLLLALFLSGCGGETEALSPAVSQEESPALPAVSVPAETGTLEASQVESTARMPTEEEILGDYDRAVRLYSWFDLAPLSDSGETVTQGGEVYRRVSQKGYATLEDLRLELRGVFTGALTERLISGEEGRIRYRDIDGALYVCGEARARLSGRGAVSVEVEQDGMYDYAVNVTVDLMSQEDGVVTGMECWAFPYVLDDGRWGFSEFRLVY